MAVASESKFSKSSAQMASGSMVVVLLAVSLVILAVLANSEGINLTTLRVTHRKNSSIY